MYSKETKTILISILMELPPASNVLMAGESVPLARSNVPKDKNSAVVVNLPKHARRAVMLTGAVTMPNSKVVNLFNKPECVRNKVNLYQSKNLKHSKTSSQVKLLKKLQSELIV